MLLERLFGERRGESLTTMADPARWLIEWVNGGAASAAGEAVSVKTAEGLPAVYRCRRLLADSVAILPLKLYRLADNGDKEEARDELLYTLLHDQPNPEMSAYDFRVHQIDSLTGWGNAYAEIQRGAANQPINLWPLEPSRMEITRDGNNQLLYRYTMPDGSRKDYRWNWRTPPIWHLRVNALDGRRGRSPIQLHRETLGAAIAVKKFGAKFFANGAATTGALEVPGALSQPQRDALKEALKKAIGGANAHTPLVLEGGTKWQTISIPNDDAQFIETAKFSLTEIGMIFGVPPHMLGDTEKSTSYGSGIEQQGLWYATYTLGGYLRAIEQSIPVCLLNTQQAKVYRAEFVRDALYQADIVARNQAYEIQRRNGVINADEWRRRENMNAIGGDAGDERWRPSSMGIAGEKPPAPALPLPSADAGGGADEPPDEDTE